jgi:ATP/ADP translocase
MWCTILNVGLVTSWIFAWMIMPDFIYRIHTRFFAISRENFELTFYSFIGVFKVFFIVFCLVPWLALLILR